MTYRHLFLVAIDTAYADSLIDVQSELESVVNFSDGSVTHIQTSRLADDDDD